VWSHRCARVCFVCRTRAQRVKRQEAERKAVNTLCQAAAADLMKVAMINVAAALESLAHSSSSRSSRSSRSSSSGRFTLTTDTGGDDAPAVVGGARIVLQIHDELLLEVDERRLSVVLPAVRAAMVGAARGIVSPQSSPSSWTTTASSSSISSNSNSSNSSSGVCTRGGAGGGSQGGGDGLINLRVPLAVTFQVGKRWGSMRDVKE
jgi:DNA polymerase I-like protein with 3'-5' exonuclease and polymerase domains